MSEYFLGRQPIFDASLNVMAYELLYRNGDVSQSSVIDGEHATSDVLINSFLEMGLTRVVGDHMAFINFTRSFLLNHDSLPPPSKQLVLEVLEDIAVDQKLIDSVGELRRRGYIIALDDFIFHEDLRPLVELANIIKIDVQALSQHDVTEHLEILSKYPVKILAEKIETPEEFDWCKAQGFDMFQGFFLSRPRVLRGQRMPANRVNTMRLLAKLQDPAVDVKELDALVSDDVTMSYRLLRYINSASFSLRKKIDSIRHAIIFLGLREIRQWANMVALSTLDDKPGELMVTCLVRAKMCELFSDVLGRGNKGTAFVIGMFSLLDAMMDTPMEELLESMPLADEITAALLEGTGPFASILNNTLAYERGDWDAIDCPELSNSTIADLYMQSVDWANQTLKTLQSIED
jgi:EAL and modified HD-GYP domain-containing signal transduction protein